MHRFVHNLAFAVVLLHISVGCCWHHSHAEGHSHAAVSAHDACPCDHHQPACHPAKPASEACLPCCQHEHDRPAPGCDGGQCVFVRPDKPNSLELVDGSVPRAIETVALRAPLGLGLVSLVSDGLPPPACSPLRLHLLNRILLI